VDFYDVKADVQALLAPRQAQFTAAEHPALHPGRSAQIVLDGQMVGHIGELHPRWRQAWDLPHAPVLFELTLQALTARPVPGAHEVPKHQPVERDMALVVAEAVTHDQLLHALHQAPTGGLLQNAVLFDIYRPKADAFTGGAGGGLGGSGGVQAGEKSLAVRLTLGATDATLTEAQIEAAMQAVLTHVSQHLPARLRA
jgi:phenylalanyl-tRNA synthetase beta chain